MANIVKGNDQGSTELEPFRAMREWLRGDPFRAMRDWLRWDPFRTIAPSYGMEREWIPSFEIRETDEAFLFRADLPGVKEADVEVSLTGNRLQVAGKREAEKETKEETIYLYERSYGTFTRSFTLPEGIDAEHAKSELKDGVLTIAIPKLAAMKPKKIEVQTGGTKH